MVMFGHAAGLLSGEACVCLNTLTRAEEVRLCYMLEHFTGTHTHTHRHTHTGTHTQAWTNECFTDTNSVSRW